VLGPDPEIIKKPRPEWRSSQKVAYSLLPTNGFLHAQSGFLSLPLGGPFFVRPRDVKRLLPDGLPPPIDEDGRLLIQDHPPELITSFSRPTEFPPDEDVSRAPT